MEMVAGTVNIEQPADTPQFVRPIMMHDFDENCARKRDNSQMPEFYNITIKALEKSERKWVFDTLEFHRIKANLLDAMPNAFAAFITSHTIQTERTQYRVYSMC